MSKTSSRSWEINSTWHKKQFDPRPEVKSWSVSCDHLVERCTLQQCRSCEGTCRRQSRMWSRNGEKPFDHLCFKIVGPGEAEVSDVDVVGKGEGELPVGHVVLVNVSVLKPPGILWVGEEPFVVLRKYKDINGVVRKYISNLWLISTVHISGPDL